MRIPDVGEKFAESVHVFFRNLQAYQHTSIVCAMIAIMEKADIPVRSHRRQETHQGARTFREFETVELFVFCERSLAAVHVADMQLAEFVVAQVDCPVIVLLE